MTLTYWFEGCSAAVRKLQEGVGGRQILEPEESSKNINITSRYPAVP